MNHKERYIQLDKKWRDLGFRSKEIFREERANILVEMESMWQAFSEKEKEEINHSLCIY